MLNFEDICTVRSDVAKRWIVVLTVGDWHCHFDDCGDEGIILQLVPVIEKALPV